MQRENRRHSNREQNEPKERAEERVLKGPKERAGYIQRYSRNPSKSKMHSKRGQKIFRNWMVFKERAKGSEKESKRQSTVKQKTLKD